MKDKNKPFDDKLLDGSFNSEADAYRMLSLESTMKDKGSVLRQFCGSRSAFKTHVVCVTDKDVESLADCKCSYSAVIKKKRKKDDNKYYIEEEGRNLMHNENCLRNSANCPDIITVRSKFVQHVQALHPISLVTTRKQVAKILAEKEEMIVRSKQARVVLNKRNGNSKGAYRNSMKAVGYHKNFFNEEDNAKMDVRWRVGAPVHGLPRNGNKYFGGYQICATGIRNFVAAVGIPFLSFDACFSKYLYYKGVYGNLVALVDTKADTLTNVPLSLTTDELEQESSYNGLFHVSERNNADSELAKRMKESVSCVIGDGSTQFLNAARTTLGHQKPIATCSLYVKENARKKCKTGWNENYFWRLQQARSHFLPFGFLAFARFVDNANIAWLELFANDMSSTIRHAGSYAFIVIQTIHFVLQLYLREPLSSHSNGVRRCRTGNWNVAPIINPDADVEVIKTHWNGHETPCQYQRTHLHLHGMKDIEFAEYGRRKQELAVDQKPWFLAQKFIEAAAIFENNLIMLPPDADIVEDDKLFPPPCLPKLKHGNRGAPEDVPGNEYVLLPPRGRPQRNHHDGIQNARRLCSNHQQAGHTVSRCRFVTVWFDWNHADHLFLSKELIMYETTRRKCYSKATKDKFVGLGWSLKESMKTANSYILSHKLSEDQFRPDPKIVEAYAEYFCETLRFPHAGKLPGLEVLDNTLLESPVQQVRHFEFFC
ncbi:unnamed protein product [Bathycoccus prasinos]